MENENYNLKIKEKNIFREELVNKIENLKIENQNSIKELETVNLFFNINLLYIILGNFIFKRQEI
jgi:hypothetical protein